MWSVICVTLFRVEILSTELAVPGETQLSIDFFKLSDLTNYGISGLQFSLK